MFCTISRSYIKGNKYILQLAVYRNPNHYTGHKQDLGLGSRGGREGREDAFRTSPNEWPTKEKEKEKKAVVNNNKTKLYMMKGDGPLDYSPVIKE